MKFTTTTVTTFLVNNDLIITDIVDKQEISSFTGAGTRIKVLGGYDYTKMKIADKYIYIKDKDRDGGESYSNPDILIPGSLIKLYSGTSYMMPEHPEEDEWSRQNLAIIINTAKLRKELLQLVPALIKVKSILSSKSVNILDANSTRDYGNAIEKASTKFIKQLEDLTETTAANFTP